MNQLADPSRKITRQFEALKSYKDNGWSYPLTAEVDLTWRCALDCKGCHSKWLHKNQDLIPGAIYTIVSELNKVGCKSIAWSGGGEPLESPWWKFAIDTAAHFKMDQGLYTYFPQPTQEKVDILSETLKFVYGHPFNTRGLVRSGGECVWTAGWLLDSENWSRVGEFVSKTDLKFFDFVDFRPLIVEGMDYSWVPTALSRLEVLAEKNPKVKYAEYKFLDLMRKDKGRDYPSCMSTDFVAVIGPNGDVYECVNRRGITVIGNILKEDIKTIWQRKEHSRGDMTACRILCRNHELNKSLYYLVGPEPEHSSFI